MKDINIKGTTDEKAVGTHVHCDSAEDLIYEFLKDRSPLTARGYQKDLKKFFEFTNHFFGLPQKKEKSFLWLGKIRGLKKYTCPFPAKKGPPQSGRRPFIQFCLRFYVTNSFINRRPHALALQLKHVALTFTSPFGQKRNRLKKTL